MKKLMLVSVLTLIVSLGFSQSRSGVSYFNWSNETTFKASQSPKIVGYGEMSSILSSDLNVDFFVFGDEYFKIDSWASYYYWFTQKYFYLFEEPELYEYFYETNNDLEMVRYISQNYRGEFLPSEIDFKGVKGDKVILATNSRDQVNSLKIDIEAGYSQKEEQRYITKRKELKSKKSLGEFNVNQEKLTRYNIKNDQTENNNSNALNSSNKGNTGSSKLNNKRSSNSSKINSESNKMNNINSNTSSSSIEINTGSGNNTLLKN